jgi:hypothetical protein
MALTNFPNGITSFGVPVIGGVGGIPFTGNYYFVDPANGADGNEGSVELPLATLDGALDKCTAGNNDVVILIGDGATTNTARLSATLTWDKNATHLIGITAPTGVAQRARIAPTAGASAFTPMVNVTASGCYFANFSLFHGFGTGTTAQICWVDAGGRNYYENVNFGGMGDAASAADAGSRSLKISGTTGENTFVRCTVGLDTIARGAANASLEFASGTPRNRFIECMFPFQASAGTPLGILTSAAAAMDRWQSFERCVFINNVESTSTTMTALVTLAASSGGLVLLKDCTTVGVTDVFSDATTAGQMYVDGGAPTAATTALAVAPA